MATRIEVRQVGSMVPARHPEPLVATTAAALGLRMDVVQALFDTIGFVVLPQRGVVERTVGGLNKYQRVAGHDYKTNLTTSLLLSSNILLANEMVNFGT